MPSATTTAGLVSAYASRFHRHLMDGRHQVVSPLGAWLLLAQLASAARTPGLCRTDADELEQVLGVGTDEATPLASTLLDRPHPAVATALAMWATHDRLNSHFRTWQDQLPPATERGPIPDQDDADRWASERTCGLIDHFPLAIRPDTTFVAATAIATALTWLEAYDLTPAAGLRSPWADRISHALTSRDATLVTTDVGLVAVHRVTAREGADVLSVIGPPDASPAQMLDIATDLATDPDPATYSGRARSLFDLPLGDGHAWTITEDTREVPAGTPRERVRSILPAWHIPAEDAHDLAHHVGFEHLTSTLNCWLDPDDRPATIDVKQATTATYSRVGFDAAAVTALGMRPGGAPSYVETDVRELTVRFARPYAVVAVANSHRHVEGRWDLTEQPTGTPAWDGLPLFAAWVTEPHEATNEPSAPDPAG